VPDAISVRQAGDLPPPSFTLHFTMDALGLGYTLPATWCVRDFHPLDSAMPGTQYKGFSKSAEPLLIMAKNLKCEG